MYRLKDGFTCVVSRGQDTSLIGRVSNPDSAEEFSFTFEEGQIDLSLLMGSDTLRAPLSELSAEGLLARNVSPVDPVVRRRLEGLDNHFAYAWDADHVEGDRLATTYDLLLDAHARKKMVRFDLGQIPLVPFSIMKRVQWMERFATGPKVLLIGDDDLAGLCLANLGFAVTVLDVDPAVLEFTRQIACERRLSIQLLGLDIRDPLPVHLAHTFDAFYADPITSLEGVRACLHRGLACLKQGGKGYLSIDPSIEGWVHRELNSAGVQQDQLLKRFNHYYSPAAYQLEALAEDVWVFSLEGEPVVVPLSEPIRVDGPDPSDRLEVRLDLFRCRTMPSVDELRAVLVDVAGAEATVENSESSSGEYSVWTALSAAASIIIAVDRRTNYVGLDYKPITQHYSGAIGRRLQAMVAAEKYSYSYDIRLPEAR